MQTEALVTEINLNMSVQIPLSTSMDELQLLLAAHINRLIQNDFGKLVFLLYRIDVSESKLKQLLHLGSGEDAGKIIATLIIQRQLEKLESRRKYSAQQKDISEDEKW